MKLKSLFRAAFAAKTGLAAVLLLFSGMAFASTTGAEFQPIYEKFEGWVQGYGGMAIALASTGIGGIMSVARQTPFPIMAGIGGSILLQYSPDIIAGIMTATI